jgi:hypothetical protein
LPLRDTEEILMIRFGKLGTVVSVAREPAVRARRPL